MEETLVTRSFEVVYLRPEQVHFERPGDTLSLTLDGNGAEEVRRYPWVVLRSCFPVSDNQQYLSVRDASDEEQPEIGIIQDWTCLSERDRQAVATELGLHYFVPRVCQVLKIKEEFGFLYWTVDTDKGHEEFVMRNSVIHYAREIGPGHWLLIDVNQARYEIPDVNALDRHSRRLVERFLYL